MQRQQANAPTPHAMLHQKSHNPWFVYTDTLKIAFIHSFFFSSSQQTGCYEVSFPALHGF